MIKTKLMWHLYTLLHTKKRNRLKKARNKVKPRLDNIKYFLVEYKDVINKHLSISFADLKNLRLTQISAITYPTYEVYENGKIVNFKSVLFYINNYVKLKYQLTNIEKELNAVERKLVSFKVFNYITDRFNTLIIEEITSKNYIFNVNNLFGSFQIIKYENSRKRVNWGESNKNKRKIIKEGKLPYYKKHDTGDNYKGVPWLVYFPTTSYRIVWNRNRKAKRLNPVAGAYSVKLSKYKISLVKYLANIIKDAEKAAKLYTKTLTDIQNESNSFNFK